MRQTVDEYREAFAVIPQGAKNLALGQPWEERGSHLFEGMSMRRSYPTRTHREYECALCPMGFIVIGIHPFKRGFWSPAPSYDDVIMAMPDEARTISFVLAVKSFIEDWDDGAMSIAEMEAIFTP